MTIEEFRSKIRPKTQLLINDQSFIVKEVVKFRFDDNNFYIKCFLNDNYVFADDSNENTFLLVKEVKTPFKQPFSKTLTYDNKEFSYLYTAHAFAEDIQGQEIFKKGDSERFWDYKAKDDSYLSLGINDKTNERLDFYGKILYENSRIEIKQN